jgi:hypothetical protein
MGIGVHDYSVAQEEKPVPMLVGAKYKRLHATCHSETGGVAACG